MRRFSTYLSIGSALFLGSFTSNAQTYGRPGEPGTQYRYGGRQSGYAPSGSPVDRALFDLSRVDRTAYVDHHEREHFRHAQEDLVRFQERWSQGRFDRGRLDRAIDNMQHLVQARQVRGRDRDVLGNDLAALRYFRDSQGREW